MTVSNPYATATHVQSYLNALGGITALVLTDGSAGPPIVAASTPTLSECEGWLDQVAAEINGVLRGCGYSTVPATGSNDVLLIRRYLAQKVAAMVWVAGFMSDELPAKVKEWIKDYDLFIKRLTEKDLRLIDQSPVKKLRTIQASRFVEEE
jgi:hypothetical protein